MLILRDEINYLNPREGKVLNLMTSVNQPLVAAADRPPELTQAYICSRQAESGLINVFVMLHLVKSNLRVLYSLEKDLPLEMLREAEDEALTFTENMGFLMDATPLAKLGEAEKAKTLSVCPLFQTAVGENGTAEAGVSLEDVVEEIDILGEEEVAGEGASESRALDLAEPAAAEEGEEGFGDLNIDSILQRIDAPEGAVDSQESSAAAPTEFAAAEETATPDLTGPSVMAGGAHWLRFFSAF